MVELRFSSLLLLLLNTAAAACSHVGTRILSIRWSCVIVGEGVVVAVVGGGGVTFVGSGVGVLIFSAW